MVIKSIEGVNMMNRWKILVNIIVLCFFLNSVVLSEDASKHIDHKKYIKNAVKPRSPN